MYQPGKTIQRKLGENHLHGYQWGEGKNLLIAFHGYSNNGSMFSGIHSLLGPDWTVLAFDLPGHGKTDWEKPSAILPEDIKAFSATVCKDFQVDKFSLLGFSLGGRLVVGFLEQAPEFIRQIVLAAPDGIGTNPLFSFANNTPPGRVLMNSILNNPERYGTVLDMLSKTGMLTSQRADFLKYHLMSPSSQKLLGTSWKALGQINPSRKKLAKNLMEYQIPLHLLMGIHDPVIAFSFGARFKEECPGRVTLHPLKKNHRVLDADGMQLAARLLNNSCS